MVNTSKILTVSYGTFSCTLEGFDDSFETMKAIAEYFRDLAADDRYFGAEPPTPDAEMLARIAEREVARQVEAHQGRDGIVLRAAEAASLATPAVMSEPGVAQAAESAVPEADNPAQDVQPTAEASAVQPDTATEYPAAAHPVSGQRAFQQPAIADPVAAPAVSATMEEAFAETPAETDEALAEELIVTDVVEAGDIAFDDDADEKDHIETAEEFFQNSPGPDAPTVYESEGVEDLTADPDSITAKLTRIRSVVLQSDLPGEEDDYSEDEHAQDFLSETAAELGAALAVDDAAELNGTHIVADDSDMSEQQADSDGSDAPSAETTDAAGDEELVDTLSQVMEDSAPEDAISAEGAENIDESVSDEQSAKAVDDGETVSVEVSEADANASDHDEMPARLSARLRKGQSTDIDAAAIDDMVVQDETSDEASHLAQADVKAANDTAESDLLLPPEQEEELLRELAEVEADLLSNDTDDDVDVAEPVSIEVNAETNETDRLTTEADADVNEADPVSAEVGERADDVDPVSAEAGEDIDGVDVPIDPAPEYPSAGRARRHRLKNGDGQTDIARIFDEADSQLEKPESNQRRNAIQHLRAAVAATRAEKKAGSDLEKGVDDTPYRSDLASVVRPNRPSAQDGIRSARPVETGPAPLKLVAEQRVDTEQEPVRPRRIAAAELADQIEKSAEESENSFSTYAREMGATQLPDLLEAAAAYMSDIEGRSQFSRPMLMHKVAEIEKENFSREDGLRSFGQLLREGKIQKIKGGRFTVTDETDFRGDRRHAG